MVDEDAVLAKLDHASELIYAQDMSIVDELWSDGFRLVGSEDGEIVTSREELAGLVTGIFGAPYRLSWVWDSRSVSIEHDIAWVFAQGHLLFVHNDPKMSPSPVNYRLVAIFARSDSGWTWRLYNGSEPLPRRPLN